MPMYVKNAGSWSLSQKIFIKDGGSWSEAKEVWIKNAGTWSRAHFGVATLTISTNTSAYDIKAATIAAGWDQTSNIVANVTINSGVVVSAPANTTYALVTNTGWPAGSSIRLNNNGVIVGTGGEGGDGADCTQSTAFNNAVAGSGGGTALLIQHPTTIYNYGTLAGGGGGGGGGGANRNNSPPRARGGGGGGGGRSSNIPSLGGIGGNATTSGSNRDGPDGGPGTYAAAGAVVYNPATLPSEPTYSGIGGAGGNWGAVGAAGVNSESPGKAGGAAGKYIEGLASATFAVTGTRLGTTA